MSGGRTGADWGAARCTAASPQREDGRCHNKAYVQGLCKVHLRMRGVLRTCERCHGFGMLLPDADKAGADV